MGKSFSTDTGDRTFGRSGTFEEVRHRTGERMGLLPVASRNHALPRRLENDFVFEKEALGDGYNGEVKGARSRRTGERFAVKSFKKAGVSPKTRANFASEVEVFLSLDHPHIVRLMEVYEDECQVSLVMECMEGGEVYERVVERGKLQELEAALTTRQMLLAINYLHNEGIVHRDLKLENFMFEERGSGFVKLLDFGFSTFFKQHKEMEESLGTVTYVAPEVLNKSYSSGSCDLWSLGVIVFAMLSGQMPFSGSSPQQIAAKIRRGSYVMKDSRWHAISHDGVDFVQRLLVLDPAMRLTAEQALAHPWLMQCQTTAVAPACCKVQGCTADAFVSFARASRFQQACMQMMAWSLTSKERRRLRSHFMELDRSQSGVMKLADLKAQLHKELIASLDAGEVDEVFAALEGLDVDGDGDLHYSDFLSAMMSKRLWDSDDVLEETFRRFDKEDCGYITPRSTKRLLGQTVSAEDVEGAFQQADGDHDGRVEMHEFVAFLRGAPKLAVRSPKPAVEPVERSGHGAEQVEPVLLGRGLRSFGARLAKQTGCFHGLGSQAGRLTP